MQKLLKHFTIPNSGTTTKDPNTFCKFFTGIASSQQSIHLKDFVWHISQKLRCTNFQV